MASYIRDDAITLVYRMLRDTGNTATEQLLTDTEIGQFVDQAVRRYSRIRPNTKVEDVTADGTSYLALPSAYDLDFSRLVQVETPTGNTPPTIIDHRFYALYQNPTAWKLLWLDTIPASGDTVRMTYTIPRVLDAASAASTTVADVDFEAVCALAASYAALAIAGKYARTSEAILSADTVNYRTKTMDWTSVAGKWQAIWEKHAASIAEPGSGWVNWDTRLGILGFDHLTHSRYGR